MAGRNAKGPPPAEILERLQAELADPSTLRKTFAFAWRRMRLLSAFGQPTGKEVVEELVNQAIVDTADGVLTWDPSKVRLSTHLCGAIRSRTWKQATRQPATKLEALPEENARQPKGLADDRTPDGPVLELEQRVLDLVLVARVRVGLEQLAEERGDEHAALVLMAYDEGKVGRTDVAEATGLTVDEVTNTRKRLVRMFKELPPEVLREAEARLRGDR